MEQLGHLELRRFDAVLPRIYALRDQARFGAEVIALLPEVVACDTCTYNETDLTRGVNDYLTWPPSDGFPEHRAVFNRYMHQHPLYRAFARTGPRGAAKISDFVSLTQFSRSALYNEYFRRLGLRRQIGISVRLEGGGRGASIAFNRAGSDFDERDRARLNLLRPHLVQAAANAAAVSEIEADLALLTAGMETLRLGLALLAPDGRVRRISMRLRRLLAACYGERSVAGGQLPEDVRNWARRAGRSGTRTPSMVLPDQRGRIVLRLLPVAAGLLVLAEEPAPAAGPLAFATLGLTRREGEVLAWICRGKSNGEIAAILEISRRTVEKHAERIFPKLGVETRLAAGSFARDWLSRRSRAE
ncbi:MAG TPA: helix-turn-helix transcriptional regulator [Caulobacteraceae bacterium]|nr:helix-turn-helix transcriptional regulator [Caulobacteraceae bacterium]